MNNLEKTLEMIDSFDWGNKIRFAAISLYFSAEMNGKKKIVSKRVSSIRKKDMLSWSKKRWMQEIEETEAFYKTINTKIFAVQSIVISFQEDSWEYYILECTDISRNEWFNRVILPTVDLLFQTEEKVAMVSLPKKEFYLRPEEQVLIHSADTLKLATKIIDPNRLKGIESDLPYVMKDKEDEWRLIKWPEYFE